MFLPFKELKLNIISRLIFLLVVLNLVFIPIYPINIRIYILIILILFLIYIFYTFCIRYLELIKISKINKLKFINSSNNYISNFNRIYNFKDFSSKLHDENIFINILNNYEKSIYDYEHNFQNLYSKNLKIQIFEANIFFQVYDFNGDFKKTYYDDQIQIFDFIKMENLKNLKIKSILINDLILLRDSISSNTNLEYKNLEIEKKIRENIKKLKLINMDFYEFSLIKNKY